MEALTVYNNTMTTETLNITDCLDYDPSDFISCSPDVEYRMAMSPTGISYPRCGFHYDQRWETQERLTRDYGVPLTYYGNDRDGWNDDYSDY